MLTEPTNHSIPSSLRPYLDEIAGRLLSGHAAVMVGSGFSKNATRHASAAPFPDWSELADRFYERLHGHGPRRRRNYLQVPALAHEIEAAFGRPALNQIIRDAIPDLRHHPSPLHVKLLDLPWSDVLTTNYDTLLERACRSVISRRYDIVVSPENLGHSGQPRIIKLHGSLPADQPFIVTDEDYRKYPHEYAPFVNTVRQALLEKTLCLVGFSGDDPNFLEWVGWIHDNLGLKTSPKMYLVGTLSLRHSERMLLERRNIIPVDMSECTGVGDDHYQGLERFLEYLRSRRRDADRLVWPTGEPKEVANRRTDELAKVIEAWKSTRAKYPRWVVVPEDRRRVLWENTRQWIERLPDTDALPGLLDLEFAFELTWRTEKCLVPIFDNHAALVEAVLNKYWPATASATVPAETHAVADDIMDSPEIVGERVARICQYLLLAMMRYYREEGLADAWTDTRGRIEAAIETLSPEHTAQYHYECGLSAMFALRLDELKLRLREWTESDAHPFWSVKRAALMAEIGLRDEAEQILERSLETIRETSNLTPTQTDYTLLSQESFAMFLLDAVRYRPFPPTSDSSEVRERRREFSGRWHTLRQYKCDPWHELAVFTQRLERPPIATPRTTETPAFDIGRFTRTYRLGPGGKEALVAYNFLRFCEDSGIPFRIPGLSIATTSGAGSLPRIAAHSSYWALATLVRIGDTKAVDEVFDRASLARMDPRSVDGLITRYLEALRGAARDIESGSPWDYPNFGISLAGLVPEILSRLCCKCSHSAKEKLIDFLLEVYRSEHRGKFRGIRNLTVRVLAAFLVHEQIAMIPKLLKFPILAELNRLEELEFDNPFRFVSVPNEMAIDPPMIDQATLDDLLDRASSGNRKARRWSVTILGRLHDLRVLTGAQSQRFGDVLWSHVGEDGLPSDTDYPRYAFLELPHPAGVDPVRAFMRYVRSTPFPAQQSKTKTAVGMGGEPDSLCRDIEASSDITWTADDVRSIVRRLIEWWDADRIHLRRTTAREASDEAGGFPSIANQLRRQLSQLVRTLSIVVMRRWDAIDDRRTRGDLRRLVSEMSEDGIPTLELEMACASLFPEWRGRVLRRIEEEVSSDRYEIVVDALRATVLESDRTESRRSLASRENKDLRGLLSVVSDTIRWGNGRALAIAIQTMRVLAGRHPWGFVDDVERSVLARLQCLVADTAIHSPGTVTIDGDRDRTDVATKLWVRQEAAGLAYRLFEVYRERGVPIPAAVLTWREICNSDEEFAEIRRQWLDFGIADGSAEE